MRNGKVLKDEQQRYVVQLLACFRTPSEVARAIQERFKISVYKQLIEHYDPTKAAGQNLTDDLKDLFWETRKSYLEQTNQIGIAHQVYRLEQLRDMGRGWQGF